MVEIVVTWSATYLLYSVDDLKKNRSRPVRSGRASVVSQDKVYSVEDVQKLTGQTSIDLIKLAIEEDFPCGIYVEAKDKKYYLKSEVDEWLRK